MQNEAVAAQRQEKDDSFIKSAGTEKPQFGLSVNPIPISIRVVGY